MQLFYTELYHLLYTQYISSLCSQRLVVDNMECYSTTLHKTLVQFCTWKRVQNTSLKNLNGNIFSSFLKSTSLTHTPHTVHKLTFKSPTEDMVAGMMENSLSPHQHHSLQGCDSSRSLCSHGCFLWITDPDSYFSSKKTNSSCQELLQEETSFFWRLRSQHSLGYRLPSRGCSWSRFSILNFGCWWLHEILKGN